LLPSLVGGRPFPRYQIRHAKKAHLITHLLDAERRPAHILDLSEVGVTLLLGRHLNPGKVVTVGLHHIPRGFGCELPARVVFAAECRGAFLLGAAFTRELTDEEMAGLL
jgi:hypothetical protein